MKRKTLLNPILILSLALALAASLFVMPVTKAQGEASPSYPGDLFVLGFDGNYNNPTLSRMDTDGNILWQRALPFSHFLDLHWSADRNLSEDSFYFIADMYFRSQQIDGKTRVLKYNSQGIEEWDIPLSPDLLALSANPVLGGIYITDARLGVYRLDPSGNILWGPKAFGIVNSSFDSVATDTTDGGAFVSDRHNSKVMKIDPSGNVIWSQTIPQAERLNACPTDGGVYVGSSSSYQNPDTYKLDADGNVEWVKYSFPSSQNPERGVNPFDGSLYVYGLWQFAHVTPSGSVPFNFYSDLNAPNSFAFSMQEGGAFAYTNEVGNHLGITKINAEDGSIVWRKDPGLYQHQSGDSWWPTYLVYAGMPSNVPNAILTATLSSTEDIYPGDPVSMDLNIQNANGLYATQAICLVDPSILTPQDGTYGDFFDPVNRLVIPIIVDPETGTWTAAISQRSPALPLSGGGLFATANFLAAGPATTAITCEPLFSDKDGFTQSVTYTGINVTVLAFAITNGTAHYQGRLTHANIQATVGSQATATNASGQFNFDQIRAGTWPVRAAAALYLPNCTSLTVTNGQTETLPVTTLKGGDVNADEAINIGDATLVAANFGMPVPPADPRADINSDQQVNIQDLAILGGNFGLSGCQSW